MPAGPARAGCQRQATLAHVLVNKQADHLPLYRQSQILARAGLDLHRAVLADEVGKAAIHLKPVVDRQAEHLKRSGKLFTNKNTAPVLDPGRRTTKTGYLWALARDDRPWRGQDPPGAVYFYAPRSAGENAETFLTGFDGIVQIDGYSGYNRPTKPSRKGGCLFGWPIAGRTQGENSKKSSTAAAAKSPPKACAALPSSTPQDVCQILIRRKACLRQ